MPYPDPTPDLLRKQADEVQKAQFLFNTGSIVAIADAIWLWKKRRRSH
jgi:hypothetical protein